MSILQLDKGVPVCTRICRAIPTDKVATPVSAITVHENLNYMAVGFENGTVQLFKGDVKSDRFGIFHGLLIAVNVQLIKHY